MAKIRLTKNDIDKIIPPKGKFAAIEQSERYEKEYEVSRKELDEILKQLEELMNRLNDSESR